MRLLLVSGLSGSGKSVALKALEDAGFYCIDNLPASLLPQTIEHLRGDGVQDAAVSIDARNGAPLRELVSQIEPLRANIEVHILFLTARDDTLMRRFSETRRRHPLASGDCAIDECIRAERELLAGLRDKAHVIDTSDLSANALRAWIKDFIGLPEAGFTLVFESFGFKHGIPLDADLVFDVRCLPNPHYDLALRPLTGMDAPVIDFLRAQPLALSMLDDIRTYLEKWLPAYIADNRSYFTVALGCTGGRHRSVFFAQTLAAHFAPQHQVLLRHRELG